MRKVSMTVLLSALLVAGTALAADDNSVRDVDTFDRVSTRGSMDLEISVGGSQQVEIFGDSRDLDNITTEVRGGVLRIRQERGYHMRDNVRVVISVADLNGIAINGSGDATATNIDSASFAMEINGSGDAELSGACQDVGYEINGSGDIEADNFKCQNAKVEINGSGDMTISASEELSVEINGSGDIDVYGEPRLKKFSSHGSGSINLRN